MLYFDKVTPYCPVHMFGYLRLFIMVSLISVVLIAIVVGVYLRSLSTNDLLALTQNQNTLLINSYREAIWNASPYPEIGYRMDMAIVEQKKAAFTEKSTQFLDKLNVDYFSLYNRAGQALFTHKGEATNIRDIVKYITHLISNGETIMHKMEDYEGDKKGNVVKIVRTVSSISYNDTIYYIEVHTNISEAYRKVLVQQWIASGSIIIVFLLLIWILILTSRRAEDIIARQHESNMELAAKAAVAEAENQQKSLFLANISHELRTPLNAIIGFSEIIKVDFIQAVPNEKFANYITDIHNAGVHLLSLINDILDFSKAEAGKLDVEITEVNINKMVKNCLRLVSPRAESGGVELVDGMPKDTLMVNTDNKKLKQILLNLLSNSVKFTPNGGKVSVNAWRNIRDESISIEVCDTGIGIAPKDLSRAMAPFGQVDSALSRKYEGTGLGLPLTKKFVELMGGTFRIESEEGKGTKVNITLPKEYSGTGRKHVA